MKGQFSRATLETSIFSKIQLRLEDFGFKKKPGRKTLVRRRGENIESLEFFFCKSRYSDDKAIFHIELYLVIELPTINFKAMELVADPWLLANAPECTIRQPIGFMLPERGLLRWSPRTEGAAERTVGPIVSTVKKWAIPFFQDYQSASNLIAGYERADRRLPVGPPFLMRVISAYLLANKPEKAKQIYETEFDELDKERYQRVRQSLEPKGLESKKGSDDRGSALKRSKKGK